MTTLQNVDTKELQDVASQVRRDILRMTNGAGSGHPGGAMGCTDLLVALYFKALNIDPEKFELNGKDEDLFFLSNGHICAVLYSTLARRGYFNPEELATHRKINSRLQGHPSPAKGLPGVRVASGSLGQGLSVATGAAQAKKLQNEDKHVYVLMGDGEQQEGQIWEAAMYAAHNKVDNLIGITDLNGAQIDGMTEDILSLGDLTKKWESFGWEIVTLNDGNNMSQVTAALEEAKSKAGNGKPVMIMMTTLMGFGVDFMQGGNAWHGKAPNAEQLEQALGQLDETIGDY